jgi:hypothetical protein
MRLTGLPVSLEGLYDESLGLIEPMVLSGMERTMDQIDSPFRLSSVLVAGRGFSVGRVMLLTERLANHRLDH